MSEHYLIDYDYSVDKEKLWATGGHLLAFNPGLRDADLKVTIYYEDREPDTMSFVAPAGTTFETNCGKWPVEPDVRFALKVESSEPVVCQATVGWNNTAGDYSPGAKTKSPHGVRECATSYIAPTRVSKDWYIADGIVIDLPDKVWVRESEWAVLLNPGDEGAQVTMVLHYDEGTVEHVVEVPARRVKRVYMDDIAQRNKHYGTHFRSSQPVVAQWLRTVNWYERSELMACWSVPCVPGPLD
jgi:hypothetical protein